LSRLDFSHQHFLGSTSLHLPLNFTFDSSTDWIGYSLDGALNVTLMGNITLADLSCGSHKLIVYANNTLGNMGVTEVTFEVKQQNQQCEFIEAALGVLAVGCIVIIGLVVKKRKKPIKGAVYSGL
jgi:hypothetical protein